MWSPNHEWESILLGFRCFCCHVFCSCSCPTPCRWSMTAAFIAHNLNECTSILSHKVCIYTVMLRIPGLISSCVRRGHTNISSHGARERVWRGVLKSKRQEEGLNGVAGQGVNSGSRVLDSTQSHRWGNHLHCLCLHPTTSDKTAWLQKIKASFIYAETSLCHLATCGFTCYYLV